MEPTDKDFEAALDSYSFVRHEIMMGRSSSEEFQASRARVMQIWNAKQCLLTDQEVERLVAENEALRRGKEELQARNDNQVFMVKDAQEERSRLAIELAQAKAENARLRGQLRRAEKEISDARRDAATEENWKHIQGEDYGTY